MSKATSIGIIFGIFFGFGLGAMSQREEINQVIDTLGASCYEALDYQAAQIDMLNNALK